MAVFQKTTKGNRPQKPLVIDISFKEAYLALLLLLLLLLRSLYLSLISLPTSICLEIWLPRGVERSTRGL